MVCCLLLGSCVRGERISAAVRQILTSKGVPERMERSSLHASCVIVLHDGEPQGVLCEEIPELFAEEIVGTISCPTTAVEKEVYDDPIAILT